MSPLLLLSGVTKCFLVGTPSEVVALNHVDLALDPGDFVTIIGSNGAGKSTLAQGDFRSCRAG